MSRPPDPIILLIDDEKQIRQALGSILSVRGYHVREASNGTEGCRLAEEEPPDLVVLDLAMPNMSGLEVCKSLRAWYRGPILVLSVRDSDRDKVAALDLGADDYLTKPFSAAELLARVRALLRRASGSSAKPSVEVGDIVIDLAKRRVTRAGEEVALTRTEFDILAYLAANAGQVVTSGSVLENVWGPEWREDVATLRVHVSHLRKKIEPEPSVPRIILTEPGVGFRLNVDEE